MSDAHRDVLKWVTRLIKYGKRGDDPELDEMSLGQVADRIIECIDPGYGHPLLVEAYRRGYNDREHERDYDPGHALDILIDLG